MNREHSDFARVYEQHVWRVYGFLAYRVRDRMTAEDLTQGTFERALRAWSRFDPRRASESTWLLSIARNLTIDHHRRQRWARHELIDERVLPAVPGPEEQFAGSPELVEALAELSARDREVIALRFGGDLNNPEIAELLDLSLANVQQIVSRSLRKLRELLEAQTPSATNAPAAASVAPSPAKPATSNLRRSGRGP
jgi:RNA polymerase sigma-70 factor (ECF subfamily)